MKYELSLLKKLVAINTDSEQKPNYVKCANLIAREARKLGLKPKTIRAKAPDKKPRPNVLIELKRGAKETLLIVTHYDIVAPGDGWRTNPFKLVKKGNLLYGRGVSDDKSAIAAALGAIRELRKEKKLRRNIKLLAACDEEVGGDYGIEYLAEKKKKALMADNALIMDSSLKHIGIGCSGIVRGYIYFKGKQGHAARPYKTPNILNKVIPFLNELKEYNEVVKWKRSRADAPEGSPHKKVWGRFNITIIKAGYKTNIIPGRVTVGFDLRVLPEENIDAALKEFREFLSKKLKKYKLKARIGLKGSPGYIVDSREPFVKEIKSIARKLIGKEIGLASELGGTDGRFISKLGIPAVGFAPGGKGTAHMPNECISLKSLQISKQLVINLCRRDYFFSK